MRTSSKYQRNSYGAGPRKKSRPKTASDIGWRIHFVRFCLYLMVAGLFLKLVHIQIIDRKKYHKLAAEQYTREYTQKAPRGLIYDRNYKTLALNKPRFDLGLDKRGIDDYAAISKKLASILKINERDILNRIKGDRFYIPIARKIGEEEAKIIEMLNIPGIKITRTSERVYPFKEKLAQVIGFADVDGNGLSGIELAFDDNLKGKDGWSILQKDAKGKSIMPITSSTKECQSGDDIVLTIDHVIQTIAEEELNKIVSKRNAKSGTAIIMDPTTGEILAMACAPGFDANQATKTKPEAWRIRAITDIFEPGSTFKVVTMMLALSEDIIKNDDIFFCENGQYKLFGETINDPESHGWLSLKNVFKYSSNIGTAKIAQKIGKEDLFKAARSFGFGNKTGIELPGEVSGILKRPSEWSKFTLAAMSYGHEVAVTALQMATAYGAIANGGMLMKPAIVKEIRNENSEIRLRFKPQVIRKVMEPKTAQKMTAILKEVVEYGTGQLAKIPNRSIAGKTGTAQKPFSGRSGYSNSKFVASFAGFYPADQAKILIFVSIDEPYPVHSGGSVAAPAVRDILGRILEIYDKPQSVTEQELTDSILEPEDEVIPDLRGRRIETATKILDELNIGFRTQGEGPVVENQAAVSATGKKGTGEIILTLGDVSEKKDYREMPDLIGFSMRKAISELSMQGIRVKVIGSGRVVKQTPEPGAKIKVGARCYLEFKPARSIKMSFEH